VSAPTLPNGFRAARDDDFPSTGQQIALGPHEELAELVRRGRVTPVPDVPYTGPVTGDQLDSLAVLEALGETQRLDRAPSPSPFLQHRGVFRTGIHRVSRSAVALGLILIVQAALSLRLIWSNTAFGDEALYVWAGHMEWQHWLHGLNITPLGFPQYFSGAPVIYPPLAAAFDSLGGLAAARCLSLVFMMGASCLLWSTTNRLYSQRAAFYATALFVLIGTAQDLGAFATYDAMAVFCLALASWLGIRGACARRGAAAAALIAGCSGMLALADAVKYASGLWNPVVILAVAAIAWQRRGMARGAAIMAATSILLGVLIAAAIRAGGHDYLTGIDFTTIKRGAGTLSDPGTTVLWEGVTLIWIIVGLSLIAVAMSWHSGWPARLFAAALFAGTMAAPLNQARIETYVSLYKHVAFGAWFGAIVAGWVLSVAVSRAHRHGWRIGAAVLGLAFVAGYGQGTTYYHYWPDVAPMLAEFRTMVTPESGPIAGTFEAHELSYYLGSQVSPEQVAVWPAPDALYHHYYKFVEVDTWVPASGRWGNTGSRNQELSYQRIADRLQSIRGYRVVITQHWTDAWYYGESRVWEYEGASK
jgi:hypothetical protein